MKNQKDVQIPYRVFCNQNLLPSAKLLFGVILNQSKEQTYSDVTNQEFAEMFNTSRVSISNWLNQLEKEGLIYRDISYDIANKTKIRKIFVNNSKEGFIPKVKFNDESKAYLSSYNIYNNKNINTNNINNKYIYKGDLTFDEMTEKSFDHIVGLFPIQTRPKSPQTIFEWKTIIQELANDGYEQREVYKICALVRESEFWHDKFVTIKQLVKVNKNGVKNIDFFKFKYLEDNQ